MSGTSTDPGTQSLIEAARRGSAAAAAEVISSYLPYWYGTAHRIIKKYGRYSGLNGSVEEPADLVQESVAALLELWRQGRGPDENIRHYVTTMMQHAYLNKLRSPRAREQHLEDFENDSTFTSTDDTRLADLSHEIDAVRRAFGHLADDHRTVLRAVTAEGLKPRDLTARFNRPAPAISNLLARAKQSLLRLLLIEYLSEGGEQCAENAQSLPNRVHLEVEEHRAQDRGIAHVRECERCQSNWRRFAAISSTLGVLPLLTLVQLSDGRIPGFASTGAGVETDRDPGTRRARRDGQPTDALSQAQSIATVSSGAGSNGAGAGAASAAGAPIGTAATVGRPLTGSLTAAISSKTALGIGVGLLAVAGIIPIASAISAKNAPDEVRITDGAHRPNPYDAFLNAHANTDEDGALQDILVDFSVQQPIEWSIEALTLSVSSGTELLSASNGLDCAFSDATASCAPTEETDPDRAFVFTADGSEPSGSFTVELQILANGDSGVGYATGTW